VKNWCWNQRFIFGVSALVWLWACSPISGGENQSGASAKPPKSSVILFDGKDASDWEHRRRGGSQPCEWLVTDGSLEIKPGSGNIVTTQQFEDFRLHLEFNTPLMVNVKGQARGNSGVYLHGLYEIQVLDSYNNETYPDGVCGAIYGQKGPDQNACKPPGQWQSYDIIFYGPRFDSAGTVIKKPRVTGVHNGVMIHDDVEISGGPTRAGLPGPMVKAGPILLQDHGCRVKYRNIWLEPLSKEER
jgi:hypothetical protein